MEEFILTQKQLTLVNAIEQLMRAACSEGVGFACDEYGKLYAYNGAEVSCFDAPQNAAYDRKLTVRMEDLHRIQYGRVDYAPTNDDVVVGMMSA